MGLPITRSTTGPLTGSRRYGSQTPKAPRAQKKRGRGGETEAHRLGGSGPAGGPEPGEVAGEDLPLEVAGHVHVHVHELQRDADQRGEFLAHRPGAEHGPVDGDELAPLAAVRRARSGCGERRRDGRGTPAAIATRRGARRGGARARACGRASPRSTTRARTGSSASWRSLAISVAAEPEPVPDSPRQHPREVGTRLPAR